MKSMKQSLDTVNLGAFSISLAVKDLEASRKFYEKFGFKVFAGDASQNWLILKNGDHAIGLFQGLFEKNILTFNPGWDSSAQKLDVFTDVRDLQRQRKAKGVAVQTEADETSTGPASFMVVDPDGNPIRRSARVSVARKLGVAPCQGFRLPTYHLPLITCLPQRFSVSAFPL